MPIGWTQWSDQARGSPVYRQDINQGFPVCAMMTDDEPLSIGRYAVIVIASVGECGIEKRRRPSGNGKRIDLAATIMVQRPSVPAPIWSLNMLFCPTDNGPQSASDVYGLERAFDDTLLMCDWIEFLKSRIPKTGPTRGSWNRANKQPNRRRDRR